MVKIILDLPFESKVKRIKDSFLKEMIKKQMDKILENPEIGKQMRYGRKGTREAYLGSFRLPYAYIPKENKIILLDIYPKDEQ